MKRTPWQAVLLAAVLSVPSAAAAAPVPVTGSVTQVSWHVVSTHTGGGGTTFTFNEVNNLAGNISGTTALTGECKTGNSGRTTCRADGAFTGSVDGRSGSFLFSQSTTTDPLTGAYSGRISLRDGSGQLAGLRGHGTIEGVGARGTYSVQLNS